MKKTPVTHMIVLICILLAGLVTFFYTAQTPGLQLAVGVITAVAYVAWGIIHHAARRDLHARVVIEYMLIGGIAIVLLATVIRQ